MGLRVRVSEEARAAWAKHDGDTGDWLPLWRHMEDSAAVAEMLWDAWLAPRVRRLISDNLPDGEKDARRLAVWLAGVHDIGKLTPAFAFQVDGLAEAMRDVGLHMGFREAMREVRRVAPHGLAGQVLLQQWLTQSHEWSNTSAQQVATIIGGHHGTPPDDSQLHALARMPDALRTPGASEALWRRVQQELLDACASEFGVDSRLGSWRNLDLPQVAQVLLSSLVIVSDWIASNPDLFPYTTDSESAQDRAARAAAAWRALDLPGPWVPKEPVGAADELFVDRFALPAGAQLRPVQQLALQVARNVPRPGLMIIEAPMGEGKTEAALAVAEVWAAKSDAAGIFFALPTMATGNAMFSRVLDWLNKLPAGGGERRSVFLAHSKAALNEQYDELKSATRRETWHRLSAVDVDGGQEVPPAGSEGQMPAVLVAHQWLAGRKKGMLASFAVGTIDQLLFAGLKSRHLVLRHLAIAGKVVIIDEAHAYDAYMNTYLERVLSWLGAYQVPVVVLSATLPAARRRELTAAYVGARPRDPSFSAVGEVTDYPLLTVAAPGEAPVCRHADASSRMTDVLIEPIDDDLDQLADRLEAELVDGGCAVVIRNTVNRVVEAAEVLRGRFGQEAVTVAHARFIDLDRLAKDRKLLDMFGPPERVGDARPSKHIVVASQVVEQSLDLDFDLLVTDLAPIDLILQRMGRLHRHARSNRPIRLVKARCLITGVDWTGTPPTPVAGSVAVYGMHVLLRSLAVLQQHLVGDERPIRLPADISPLVQQAYGPSAIGPEAWAETMDEAFDEHLRKQAEKRQAADAFRVAAPRKAGSSLVGWLNAGVGEADDTRAGHAQVRDGRESLEVIVVQQHDDGKWTTPEWLAQEHGGLPLPQEAIPTSKAAKVAAGCALRLPWQFTHSHVIDKAICELERLAPAAWQSKDCHWLAGELILPLKKGCQASLAGFLLSYTPEDGLKVTRDA